VQGRQFHVGHTSSRRRPGCAGRQPRRTCRRACGSARPHSQRRYGRGRRVRARDAGRVRGGVSPIPVMPTDRPAGVSA
jgi:hypothetical protein